MLRQCFNFLTSCSKYFAILCLVLVAVYVLLARVTLHFLPDYKHQVLDFLNENTTHKINIESISSYWDGFDPVLQINGFELGNVNPLSISSIHLNFSFIQSVLSLQPKFDRILVDNSSVTIHQNDNGHWEFLDISTDDFNELTAESDDSSHVLHYFSMFNGTTINIKNLNTHISNETGAVRALRLPKLNVNYQDDELFVSGQVLESLGEMTLLNFSLQGRGLLTNQAIKGTLFIEARSDQFFGELLQVYDWQKVRIRDVDGGIRSWISFDGMDVSSIYGDVQVSKIAWQANEKQLPDINNLAFSFLFHKSLQSQQVAISNLGFEWSSYICDRVGLQMTFFPTQTVLQSDRLNIECANNIALALDILPADLQDRLSTSKPSGYIENIHLVMNSAATDPTLETLATAIVDAPDSAGSSNGNNAASSKTENQPQAFVFEAGLVDVSLDAYESTPSGKHIDGYVYADNQGGYVSFLSEGFELGFPELFLEPWTLALAEGKVAWQEDQDELTISSDGLRLWREDDSLIYGDFILRLNDQHTEDYLALSLGMQDIAVKDAVKFVPFYAVNEGLYAWLSQSLIGGKVADGVYYGYGSVDDVTSENSFTSSLALNTQNAVLQFDQDWPFLEGLNSQIYLQNGLLSIAASESRIVDTPLQNLKADLPEETAGEANFIAISADATLTPELVNYWLTASPIASQLETTVKQLAINSAAQTKIKLAIPVTETTNSKEPANLTYNVQTNLLNGAITHLPSDLEFTEVSGLLSVDSQTGINSKRLDAKMNGSPARLKIETSMASRGAQTNIASLAELPTSVENTENDKTEVLNQSASNQVTQAVQTINISMEGALAIGGVFDYFEQTLPAPLSGEFIYQADLSISDEANKHPLLTVKSNLIGVACDCPEPFFKSIDEQANMTLSVLLKPEQSYLDALISRPNKPSLETELLFIKDELTFGEILIGGAKVASTDVRGLNIAAKLATLNVEEWIAFLDSFSQHNSSNDNETDLFRKVQLEVASINAFDYEVNNANLLISPIPRAWSFSVNSDEALGNIEVFQDSSIALDFDHLALNSISKNENNESDNSAFDPRRLPDLTFRAKKLSFEDRHIGSWQFTVVPDDLGSIFKNIKGYVKGNTIDGQLNWRFANELHSSIATFELSGEDISVLFEVFDLPALLSSERFQTDLALVWPDSPMNFELGQLSGNILLNLEDGFLKTEDEKTGPLRLLGVLNAESIKRRLKLDFSDLYKSGVGYDTFFAKAVMDQGLLTLAEPMVIDGPAGKYVLNGRSDLGTKALDFDMLVELPFSQNVPLAALVLGAPQIGGLVWVADKLLGEPLSALTTSRYDITGTWEEPRVDLHQAMNASKKDRSKEKGTRDVGTQK